MRLPRERFDYSAIRDRRPWKLPDGARIAVWTIVNIEDWDIEKAMPRQVVPAPAGAAVIPDVPNWAWHDYGMRVGFWRLHEALTKRRGPATTAVNPNGSHSYPPAPRGGRARAARPGPVRPVVRRGRTAAARHGDRRPSLYLRGAPPDQVPRGRLRLHQEEEGRLAHDGRGDLRLVPEPARPGAPGRRRACSISVQRRAGVTASRRS